MDTEKTNRKRGRPVAFDTDQVLEKALRVFWRRGYEGASMAELADAMGINKPSIYAAFGNKTALFQKALEKYLAGSVSYIMAAMQEPSARRVAERILLDSAHFLTDPDNPGGCMINVGSLSCGVQCEAIKQILIAHRQAYEEALVRRFSLAREQSDLPRDARPGELAKYVATVHQGMSVQAVSGATREELVSVARMALRNWPGVAGQPA